MLSINTLTYPPVAWIEINIDVQMNNLPVNSPNRLAAPSRAWQRTAAVSGRPPQGHPRRRRAPSPHSSDPKRAPGRVSGEVSARTVSAFSVGFGRGGPWKTRHSLMKNHDVDGMGLGGPISEDQTGGAIYVHDYLTESEYDPCHVLEDLDFQIRSIPIHRRSSLNN